MRNSLTSTVLQVDLACAGFGAGPAAPYLPSTLAKGGAEPFPAAMRCNVQSTWTMPHVMIVEDDPLARRSMAFRAMDSHWRVTTLADGRELVRMLHDEPADLLLIDLGLPHVDGLSLVEDLRANGITLPVLIVTAHELPHLRATVLGAGANDLLQKPFDPDDLMHRLARLLAA